MSEGAIDSGRLDRECVAFSIYLTGRRPSEYVCGKYRDAHMRVNGLRQGPVGSFDRWLIEVVTRYPGLTRLVDSYTAVFFKAAHLREKWVLLLAILETSPGSNAYFDAPDRRGHATLCWRVVRAGMAFVSLVALSAVVVLPVHTMFAAWRFLPRGDV